MAVRRRLVRRPPQEPPPDPIHYQEVLERFVASKDSINTRELYRRAVVDFFERVGMTDVTRLDGDDIIAYNEALTSLRAAHDRGEPGGLAPDTIRTRIYAVRSFLRFAYAYGITPHMPPERVAEFLPVPSAKELTQTDTLARAAAADLRRAAWEEPRDRCLILLMLQSGLRVSEVAALRCNDVYEAGGRYWVDVYRGKGDKNREVEIPESAFIVVRELIKESGRSLRSTKPLFLSQKGGFLTRIQVYRIVRKYAKRAGINKRVSPHNLRHTYANQQRLLGERLEVLALQLGHKQLDTTRRYTQPARLRIRSKVRDWMAETAGNGEQGMGNGQQRRLE